MACPLYHIALVADIDGVCGKIVASMNPSTTVGRHPISTRFTAIARCAYMTYPDRDQLNQV
eukprot:scaffold113697_cov21-Prasinocladus_malaysianus.AAC.1